MLNFECKRHKKASWDLGNKKTLGLENVRKISKIFNDEICLLF